MSEPKESWINAFKLWQRNKPNGRLPTPTEIEELIEVATTRGLLVEELKAKLELEQRVNKVLVEALKAECPCINNYPDGICRCEIYQTLAEAEKLREE